MRLLTIAFFFFIALAAQSQDLVIFNAGDTLECKILGVNYAGVHTKSYRGRVIYEKDKLESYRYNNVWVQVAGPTSANAVDPEVFRAREQLVARQNFEYDLNSAGNWLISGVVVSTLLIGTGLLLEDSGAAVPLIIAGGLFLPISTIAAGAQLKSASRSYKSIKQE
jgi:hypothetical protein